MNLPSPDARGWVGISVFALTVMVLWMVAVFPELRQDEFFKVLATAIVLTGFVQGVVGWAYTATKQGGELAERNASMVEQVAQTTANTAASASQGPQEVKVVNPPSDPVPTETVTEPVAVPDFEIRPDAFRVIERPASAPDISGLPENLR